jgi:hypothetical protein
MPKVMSWAVLKEGEGSNVSKTSDSGGEFEWRKRLDGLKGRLPLHGRRDSERAGRIPLEDGPRYCRGERDSQSCAGLTSRHSAVSPENSLATGKRTLRRQRR